jgi:hypothetical protein
VRDSGPGNRIKAIETHYAGCRFRSRLEARWAVFFDTLGIAWEYEPEGFELPAGPYLPDFLLSRDGEPWSWVEVKGKELSNKELALGFELAAQSGLVEHTWTRPDGTQRPGHAFRVPWRAVGNIPDPRSAQAILAAKTVIAPREMIMESPPPGYTFGPLPGTPTWPEGVDHATEHPCVMLMAWVIDTDPTSLRGALRKARSARFEHGERG